jgi:InsA N-terminal domain
MAFWGKWGRYVPVAERRATARREMDTLHKQGKDIQPVTIDGRTIARSFWGKGWCDHLESGGVSDLYFHSNVCHADLRFLKGGSMALIPVQCPYCQSKQVIKGGKTDTGKQRYRCHNPDCVHQSFLLEPAYKGRLPEIKQHIIDELVASFRHRRTPAH